MPTIRKPSEKEIVTKDNWPISYECSVCGVKYYREGSKVRCEQWHEYTGE